MGEEYYDRLGVSAGASTEEIVSAYRERLKEVHPDVSDKSDAREQTRQLIRAKEVLTDEQARAQYDRLGHERYLQRERGEEPKTRPPRETDAASNATDSNRSSRRRASRQSGAQRESESWEEMADAIWDEVTDENSGTDAVGERTAHTTRTGANTTMGAETGRTASGGTTTGAQTGRTASGGTTTGAQTGRTASGGTTMGAQTGRTASGGTTGGNWRVHWYTGGDPSGTADGGWTVGNPDMTGEPWRTWSPTTNTDRYTHTTFPPHRIFTPLQSVSLFGLFFLTYPLVLLGALFPLFTTPTRLAIAVFLLFVVAVLIVIPQLGAAVFGGWSVLFPLVFLNTSLPLTGASSVAAIVISVFLLCCAVVAHFVIRPPAL